MPGRTILVTGGSCTGKSTVCRELERRGVRTVDGDRDLAYQGDPVTAERLSTPVTGPASHWHHLWDVTRARNLAAAAGEVVIFCGDARNLDDVLDVFDEIVVLQIDETTLRRRLESRPATEFGATPGERDLVLRLHREPDRWPSRSTVIDATRPVEDVVDDLLRTTSDGSDPTEGRLL